MGLFGFIRDELIDVIEWVDDSTDTLVHRFPDRDREIKMGAQLTVRPSQVAIFINEGQIADVYQPGRYELTTANMPVLTTLKSWKYGFESPFKAEVYFVNTKQFTNQKWGTSNPIMMRDQDFGMVRLRSYGVYSFKVADAVTFLKEVFGTNASFSTEAISQHLRRIVVSGLSDLVSESKISAIDLAMYYDELGVQAQKKLDPRFADFGLKLQSFIIENISLPEEVEKAMDKRTSMGVLGDLNRYTKYQASEAIRDAAQNEGGGLAGAGVSLGAGAALGRVLGDTLQPNPSATASTVSCPHCQAQVAAASKFCSSCGKPLKKEAVHCVKCQAEIPAGAKFCPECGSPQEQKCSKCGTELPATGKFCPECGAKVE